MTDNRKHPRKLVRHAIAFKAGDGARVEGTCNDLSLGGMFIETSAPATFGGEVTIYLTLPGLKQETVIKSLVRWTKPTGMGVQFGVMGARETHALTQLIG